MTLDLGGSTKEANGRSRWCLSLGSVTFGLEKHLLAGYDVTGKRPVYSSRGSQRYLREKVFVSHGGITCGGRLRCPSIRPSEKTQTYKCSLFPSAAASPLQILGNSDFGRQQEKIWAKPVFKDVSMFFFISLKRQIFSILI